MFFVQAFRVSHLAEQVLARKLSRSSTPMALIILLKAIYFLRY